MNGYANLIGSRLRKLAEEKSTGILPVSGHGDGAIYFRDGQVVFAESGRTPAPVLPTGQAALGLVPNTPPPMAGLNGAAPVTRGGPAGLGGPSAAGRPGAGSGELELARSVARLTGALAVTEAVIDAATELLASDSRYAKFRQPGEPPAAQAHPLNVATLLAEVQRRHTVLAQLATVLTPDTGVVRSPSLDAPSAQVTQAQWALVVRAGEVTSPRALALLLGRSVFGTTLEVQRLVELGLLAVPGRPRAGAGTGPRQPAVSFIRAVSGERGSDG